MGSIPVRRGSRGFATLAAALAALGLTATAADAGSCAWGPIKDATALRALLGAWAESADLPPLQMDECDATIDGGNVRLALRFARGALTLGWTLDEACEPTAISILASPDYEGRKPDEDAVEDLATRLRTVTTEQVLGPRPVELPARPLLLLIVFAALVGLFWTRLRAPEKILRAPTRAGWIRLLGCAAIVALLPYGLAFPPMPGFLGIDAPILFLGAIALLVTFLWLYATGTFGFGSPRRDDWPALAVFLLALALREGYARHAIAEIEIHFYYGSFPNRHSAVHPLFGMFFQSLAGDPYWFMMHVNGVFGALATLPLYLFVRQRTDNWITAVLVATFFAIHPIIVQMAPTDGQYSLMLFAWFAGLALLTAHDVGPKQLFGGAAFLGIAATCRAEGSLFLLASLLLIDVRALLRAARRHLRAAVLSSAVLLSLIALHVSFVFPHHRTADGRILPTIGTVSLRETLRAGLRSDDFNDRILVELVLIGALAGLVERQFRIGLGAALGTLIVVWPVSMTTTGGFTILHRLVPVCALQVIAAGVGASWFTSWLPRIGRRWIALIPGLAVAWYVFAAHRHEIRAPNAVTEEFWMLRNHLAPGGRVNDECTLLTFGRTMDTDIHNFTQVLPGVALTQCEEKDCLGAVAEGGCFYYLRSLNCFWSDVITPPECLERGRTQDGDLYACLEPRCTVLERSLDLAAVEERSVDLYAVFNGLPDRPQTPRRVDIGLYRVNGIRR